MEIYAEIAVGVYPEFAYKRAEEERELRNKLKSYVVRNDGELIGDVYKVEYMSQLYNEIMKFGENMDEVDLIIEYFYKYTDEELEKAKMFWLNPTRSYIQSKDYNDYPCDTCGRRILKDVNIIKVGKKVKGGRPRKMFKFGAGIEELLCVSVDLYNYFLDNGANSEDFRPVYCGKEMQGYAFTPIEEYDIRSSVYEYRICESCGREYALYDIPKGYHPEKFELRSPIDFSAHDVYKTKVYYDREQRILISPKLFKLMKNYIKDNEYKAIF